MPVNPFYRILHQGKLSLIYRTDDRVRAQAARCLAGVLSPIFQQFSSNLKDREHLVDQLFTTYELGPVYVQVEVLKALSEFGLRIS